MTSLCFQRHCWSLLWCFSQGSSASASSASQSPNCLIQAAYGTFWRPLNLAHLAWEQYVAPENRMGSTAAPIFEALLHIWPQVSLVWPPAWTWKRQHPPVFLLMWFYLNFGWGWTSCPWQYRWTTFCSIREQWQIVFDSCSYFGPPFLSFHWSLSVARPARFVGPRAA